MSREDLIVEKLTGMKRPFSCLDATIRLAIQETARVCAKEVEGNHPGAGMWIEMAFPKAFRGVSGE